MFDIPQSRTHKRNRTLLASFLIHCLLVFLWLDRAPMFVRPSAVA